MEEVDTSEEVANTSEDIATSEEVTRTSEEVASAMPSVNEEELEARCTLDPSLAAIIQEASVSASGFPNAT